MKHYCNMVDGLCRDIFSILDEFELEDAIHPFFLPLYQGNQVPSYVRPNWRLIGERTWVDRFGVKWVDDAPQGPTPDDPNYTGPWPILEEEPDTSEETSE